MRQSGLRYFGTHAGRECSIWSHYSFWRALRPEEQAAWVQAIGSLMAIFTAVIVPMVQRNQELWKNKSNGRPPWPLLRLSYYRACKLDCSDDVLTSIDDQQESGRDRREIMLALPSVAPKATRTVQVQAAGSNRRNW